MKQRKTCSKAKPTYYAISGKNGYGVCDTQLACRKLKKYIRESRTGEFQDPYKALGWVSRNYYEFEENQGDDYTIASIEKVNEAKFRKKAEKIPVRLFIPL